MTQLDPYASGATGAPAAPDTRPYWRIAVWIAIGALIAAGLVCVVWVLVGGSQNGLIARAFLTILLLAGFAGAALFDASVSQRREQWYVLVSMIGWVIALLAGAVKIWLPLEPFSWSDTPFLRFIQLIGIVLVIRLAILHAHLFMRAVMKDRTTFTRAVGISTVALVAALAILLVVPMLFPRVDYGNFYWRLVVAVSILAAIGTALVPLVRALNSPRRAAVVPGAQYGGYDNTVPYASAPYAPAPATQSWPTYADGRTPLPVMPDGSPDWNAYYTGYPSIPQHAPVENWGQAQYNPAPAAPQGQYPTGGDAAQGHSPTSAQQHAAYGQHLGVQYPPAEAPVAPSGSDHTAQGQFPPPVPPMPPAPPQH